MKDCLIVVFGGFSLLLLLVGLYLVFVLLLDVNQKEFVWIYYLYVFVVWMSYMVYVGIMIYSFIYLVWCDICFDCMVVVSVEFGVLMMVLVLFFGSLWVKLIWGIYWIWDFWLMIIVVGLLIYFGYFIICGLIDDLYCCVWVVVVLGIVGMFYIFVNYMSVYWWCSIYQIVIVKILGKFEFVVDF